AAVGHVGGDQRAEEEAVGPEEGPERELQAVDAERGVVVVVFGGEVPTFVMRNSTGGHGVSLEMEEPPAGVAGGRKISGSRRSSRRDPRGSRRGSRTASRGRRGSGRAAGFGRTRHRTRRRRTRT